MSNSDNPDDLKRFNSPDFGIMGPKMSSWQKGAPTSTSPGLAHSVDVFNGLTQMMQEYYAPNRVDDGISGKRLAKIIYFEIIPTDRVIDPVLPTLLASVQGDPPRDVLCVYAAVAGGTSSMLPLPKSLLGEEIDYTRIYRFPRFYAWDEGQDEVSWINQTCWVEYLEKDSNSYGLFVEMANQSSPMVSYGAGGCNSLCAPGGSTASAFSSPGSNVATTVGNNSMIFAETSGRSALPSNLTEAEKDIMARLLWAETSMIGTEREWAGIVNIILNRATGKYSIKDVAVPPGRSAQGVWNGGKAFTERFYSAHQHKSFAKAKKVIDGIVDGTIPNPIGSRKLFVHPKGLKRCSENTPISDRRRCVGGRQLPAWSVAKTDGGTAPQDPLLIDGRALFS